MLLCNFQNDNNNAHLNDSFNFENIWKKTCGSILNICIIQSKKETIHLRKQPVRSYDGAVATHREKSAMAERSKYSLKE